MRIFRLTNATVQDLRNIAKYTEEQWGREQRNFYLKQLDSRFQKIAKNPLAGKPCDYITQGYRKLPEGSHVIYYANISDEHVDIIRILHKQMDVDTQF